MSSLMMETETQGGGSVYTFHFIFKHVVDMLDLNSDFDTLTLTVKAKQKINLLILKCVYIVLELSPSQLYSWLITMNLR